MSFTKTSVVLKTRIFLQCLGPILTSNSPNWSKAWLDILSPQLLLLPISKPKDDMETSCFNPFTTVLNILRFLNVYTSVSAEKWIEKEYYLLTGRDTLPGGTHQPRRPDQVAKSKDMPAAGTMPNPLTVLQKTVFHRELLMSPNTATKKTPIAQH